jgi:hypothetical protein
MKNKITRILDTYSKSIGCLIISVFCLFVCVNNLISIYKLNYNFNEVDGVVLKADLEKVYQSTDDGEGGADWFYVPKIEYQYEVDGKIFVGNRYRPSNKGEEKYVVLQILNKYPIGKKVGVFYQVGSPENSLLTKQVTKQAIVITFGTGTIFIVLLILTIYFGQKSWATDKFKDNKDI